MCGITGILQLDSESASSVLVRRMTDALAHRGPDGDGIYIDGPLGFGHRRLAILDPTPRSRQPMVSADSRVALTYNGEIYNFQELRAILQALGHVFHGTGDSAVVLAAWQEWGPACVERFNGHFALAVWNSQEQTLYLARDRYGAKPLYWTIAGKAFLFASEQKALLLHPAVRREPDLEGLVEYFTFQNFFSDRTLFKNIGLLAAGTVAAIPLGGDGQPRLHQYWDYHFREPCQTLSPDDYDETLDRLLRQAVRRQLVSDVEVGAYLSGGLDSGIISALAARELPYIKSFTCGFDLSSATGMEMGFDERVRAEAMSALFRTEHYEMVLKSGDMERIMPRLAYHVEEPRVGQSYPNFYMAQLAGKFVKVVLAGTGGDELFGGYPWRYYRICRHTDFASFCDGYYGFWQRLLPDVDASQVFAPIWSAIRHVDTKAIFRDVFARSDRKITCPQDAINLSMYFEAKTFLHGLLVIDDKLAMAHGLETRLPFLDNDLVDFAMSCPVHCKLNRLDEVVQLNENAPGPKSQVYFQRTRDGKQILRNISKRYIPADIANAVKQGFSAPDASWFKGESIEFVKRRLLNPKRPLYEFLDFRTIAALLDEHFSGISNRRLLIWSLLSFDYWLETFFH